MECLIRLLKTRPIVLYPAFNDALITRARSRALSDFLYKSDADVMLMIDSDIAFLPEHALKICDQAMTHDIVVGQYVTRNYEQALPTTFTNVGKKIVYGTDLDELVEVRYGATGFMAIHRRVAQKLAKRRDMPLCHPTTYSFHPFFNTEAVKEETEWIFASEDFFFCRKARQEGFRVWLNPGVRLSHIGEHFFRLEDMLPLSRPAQPVPMSLQLNLIQNGGISWDIQKAEPEPPRE